MRLILAVSADGFLARNSEDDMTWTGPDDKAVFRLLTSVGGACICGSTTFRKMPKLAGRDLRAVSRDPTVGLPLRRYAEEERRSGDQLWLLGGPTVALEALRGGYVTEAHLVRNPACLSAGLSAEQLLDCIYWAPDMVTEYCGLRVERYRWLER